MNKKSVLAGGAGIVVIAALGVGMYVMSENKPAPVPPPVSNQEVVAKHVMSYKDGNIALYDVKEGKLVGEFDLNSLSKNKTTGQVTGAVEESIADVKPASTPTPETTTNPADTERIGDFIKVPVTVKTGDTSWGIQSSLTPNKSIVEMLKLVGQLNKRLHPIYPGEQMTFLKEDDGSKTIEGIKPETPVKEATDSSSSETSKDASADKYVYYGSVEQSALYVYSNTDHALYRVSGENDKVDVKTVVQNDELPLADHLYVFNEKVVLTHKDSNVAYLIRMQEPSKFEKVELEGNPSGVAVMGDNLMYTYSNRLGKLDLQTKAKENVMMGDKSLDLTVVNETLYILNAFGEKSGESLLYQVNPDDLKVNNLLKLGSNQSAILSKGDSSNLYVGVVNKTKTISGKVVSTSSAATVNQDSLTMELSNWKIPFSTESYGNSSLVYMLDQGHVKVYGVDETTPEKDFEIKGDHFAVLP